MLQFNDLSQSSFLHEIPAPTVDWEKHETEVVQYRDDFITSMCYAHRSNKTMNNGSACPVPFLSTTGLFLACRKISEQDIQLSALTIF